MGALRPPVQWSLDVVRRCRRRPLHAKREDDLQRVMHEQAHVRPTSRTTDDPEDEASHPSQAPHGRSAPIAAPHQAPANQPA